MRSNFFLNILIQVWLSYMPPVARKSNRAKCYPSSFEKVDNQLPLWCHWHHASHVCHWNTIGS